ncbi:MAG: hypothetical protein HY744_17130 [Deltaproteobacteria bacterium]|nr:hypothetical protein [Deltaproteobacteria bacterium]
MVRTSIASLCRLLLASVALAGGCQAVVVLDGPDVGASGGGGGEAAGGALGFGSGGGGSGAGPECVTQDDCGEKGTTCHPAGCEAGKCGFNDADESTPCAEDGGKVCDGKGTCVECTKSEHCTGATHCDAYANKCVPPSCENGMQDGEETDADCGGVQCAPCGHGKTCEGASDCASKYCESGQCSACAGDDDCAGAADTYCSSGHCVAKKNLGATCSNPGPCLSGHCADGVCCDEPCAGLCDACSKEGGAPDNGTCQPLAQDMECRPAAGACDVAEVCDGMKSACPADVLKGKGTPCQSGTCDGSGSCVPGLHLWSKRFGDASDGQAGYRAAVDGSGNVFVVGRFEGSADFGGGPLKSEGLGDIFLAKLGP